MTGPGETLLGPADMQRGRGPGSLMPTVATWGITGILTWPVEVLLVQPLEKTGSIC